jgi:ribonuclease Z
VDLSVLFLGTAGSMPTVQRAPAGLLIRRGGDRLLFDCGEGTQRQLLRSVGLPDVERVFLTHFHADHVLGLPGMMKTFALRGREVPLHIYGPRGLTAMMSDLRRIYGKLSYEVELVELGAGGAVELDGCRVGAYKTVHGTESLGYALVEDDRPGRFDADRARALGVEEGPQFGVLQRGSAVQAGERTVEPGDVLGQPRPGRKVVISGDTMPCEATALVAAGAELLVHESTFLDEEEERAAQTGHSTARQAAAIGRDADVGMLALTHLSPRYFAPAVEEEARSVFERAVVPRDFDVVEVPYRERGEATLMSLKEHREQAAPKEERAAAG